TGAWYADDEAELEAQYADSHWLVKVDSLKAFSAIAIRFKPDANHRSSPQAGAFQYDARAGTLITPFYALEWNVKGQLSRIYDREKNREVLSEGEAGNVLQVFEDKPLDFDAW